VPFSSISRLALACLAAVLYASPAAQGEERQWLPFRWFGATVGGKQIERLALHLPATLTGLPGEHQLQLDTGASHTVLHGGALQDLDPAFVPGARSMAVSGTMAGVAVTNEPVGVIPDFRATLGDGSPMPIIGSLGLSFFAERILVLDYPRTRFLVLPKHASLPDDLAARMEFVPATLRNGKLYLPVTLNGHVRGDIFFDTGASAFALTTSPESWRALTGRRGTERSNRRLTVSSWDTNVTLVGASMQGDLTVGTATLRRPLVWHTLDERFSFSAWPDTDGFIGNELFAERFAMVLDLPNRRLGIATSGPQTP
jgi:hypothetical protein